MCNLSIGKQKKNCLTGRAYGLGFVHQKPHTNAAETSAELRNIAADSFTALKAPRLTRGVLD